MLSDELIRQGQHVMTVCNACRYCEAYCPVFPAMERRVAFSKGDLAYLANLCHNCGECLYACPYSPPHEFGINVPRTLAEIRTRSYEEFSWPKSLSASFAHHRMTTMVSLAAGFVVALFAAATATDPWWTRGHAGGDFYQVVPHKVMVALFGGVSLLVLIALITGCVRFCGTMSVVAQSFSPAIWPALRDAFTLKYLHASGVDCTDSQDARQPWRRWFHHLTFYGFALCFASTSVAALYHIGFGWRAPYPYTSLPVVLGTLGGVGLLIGPSGLLALRRTRDALLNDPARVGLDTSFATLLLLTSATGLLLLVFRGGSGMAALLVVHLASVLALFLTLPYGKFVHGIYRTAALIKYSMEVR